MLQSIGNEMAMLRRPRRCVPERAAPKGGCGSRKRLGWGPDHQAPGPGSATDLVQRSDGRNRLRWKSPHEREATAPGPCSGAGQGRLDSWDTTYARRTPAAPEAGEESKPVGVSSRRRRPEQGHEITAPSRQYAGPPGEWAGLRRKTRAGESLALICT